MNASEQKWFICCIGEFQRFLSTMGAAAVDEGHHEAAQLIGQELRFVGMLRSAAEHAPTKVLQMAEDSARSFPRGHKQGDITLRGSRGGGGR